MDVRLSILICTRNRADALRETLAALGRIRVPSDLPAELIIGDNGSSDDTSEVVQAAHIPNMAVRYVRDPRPGRSFALNTALRCASGQIIVLSDDDVQPPEHWLEEMCRPISDGSADAVAGRIRLAQRLERAWMTPSHRTCLAAPEVREPATNLVGASMAFRKAVLERIPGLDPELGPGGLGFNDDTLFGQQLLQAGYRCITAPASATVEHHCAMDRLGRQAWLDSAKHRGRSRAYVAYHWRHENLSHSRAKLCKAHVWLACARVAHLLKGAPKEGIHMFEYQAVMRISFLKHFRSEQRRARNYARFGLVKISGTRDTVTLEAASSHTVSVS
jgi:glycosyltransferase involved in cell wall biosynthesis